MGSSASSVPKLVRTCERSTAALPKRLACGIGQVGVKAQRIAALYVNHDKPPCLLVSLFQSSAGAMPLGSRWPFFVAVIGHHVFSGDVHDFPFPPRSWGAKKYRYCGRSSMIWSLTVGASPHLAMTAATTSAGCSSDKVLRPVCY